MKTTEIYISTDVETDGPIPGVNSMLSFASAAYNEKKELLGTFSANLYQLTTSSPDPKTASWWETQPEAWESCRTNLQESKDVMINYAKWLESFEGRVVFVAYPLAFDFMWIYWYLMKFNGYSPFLYYVIDIRSYAMGMTQSNFQNSSKKHYPKEWFDELPHTHVALDDAIEQGAMFINMVQANVKMKNKDIQN